MVAGSLFVKWFGPYCLVGNKDENIFTNLLGERKGVYLLAIPFDGKHLVYYVGETGVSFSQRLLQLIPNYLSGFYRLFNPEEFAEGRKILVWGGMWKSDRKDPKFILDFLKRHSELAPKILRFVEQFRVFLAPIDADKRILERIESEIARSINEQKTNRHAQPTTQKLRQPSLQLPTSASRPPRKQLHPPTKTHSQQNQKPKTSKNTLSHLPTLQRNNALPQNQRHIPCNASTRPQKHQKHTTIHPARRSIIPRRTRLYIKSSKNPERHMLSNRSRIRVCNRV